MKAFRLGELTQHRFKLDPGYKAFGKAQFSDIKPDIRADKNIVVILLAPH